jgi:CRISPR-associated protein Csm1
MTSSPNSSQQTAHEEALKAIQQAVWDLVNWAGLQLGQIRPKDSNAIARAKEHIKWSKEPQMEVLRVLFDSVNLSSTNLNPSQNKKYFWEPNAIANSDPVIPYPITQEPKGMEGLKTQIREEIGFLKDSPSDWENLSLLTLILEKFGSFLSYGEENVALVDLARTTAAVAAAIAEFDKPESAQLSIVAGDLSGIQNFIYTISSDGALKSLRARSFYLELVTEEVVAQLLTHLKLPRTNVIYAGGGNIYILAPGSDDTKKIVEKVRLQFNKWLLDKFQGKIYLALDSSEGFPITDIGNANFSEHWSKATKKLAVYKARKFGDRIEDITKLTKPERAYTPCKVCHRDDEKNLKVLNEEEPGSPMVCSTCRNMFDLGGKLFRVDAIVRSKPQKVIGKQEDTEDKLWFQLGEIEGVSEINVYYKLVDFDYQKKDNFENLKQTISDNHTVLFVNNWDLQYYKFRNCVPILLGNYGKTISDGTRFMRAEEMAEKARESGCIPRVGYLRMDVDNLGRVFADGLDKEYKNLPRIAGLSRQMSYFFKVYLNSLAKFRQENFLDKTQSIANIMEENPKHLTPNSRDNLMFIYAGGDDLFISGAWNEVVEFAFDINQCFRAYTGYNPYITISGGISIDDIKFPLYQSAKSSGKAEDAAKGNGKDSLGLFDQVFKWNEWLGGEKINIGDAEIKTYLESEAKPKLLGILPFVETLNNKNIGVNYSRNFVRNLLITAEIQEKALEKFEDKKSQEALGTRYYLHLPKVAYTLARLPKNVLDDYDFRTSLKSPYNAPYFRAIATWIELLNRQ